MSKTEQDRRRFRRIPTRIGIAATALLCLGVLSAPPASANFEQVANFAGTPGVLKNEQKVNEGKEQWPEEVQLGGLGGLAVNRTGAGGVPAGTVYAATNEVVGSGPRVAMFEPEAGGGLKFVEGWEVTNALGEPPVPNPYEPCGPVAQKLPDGSEPGEHSTCPSRPAASGGNADIGVDQTTGNVYVFADIVPNKIVEYSADGASEVARFGKGAPEGKSLAETPQELHTQGGSPLTVGPAGTVYVSDDYHDFAEPSKSHHRTMVFKPHNGDYADYEYAGEVAAGPETEQTRKPEVDDAGNFYAIEYEARIVEYAPETPAAYPAAPASPICSFEFTKGGLLSLTVDPTTGEVFFYSSKELDTIHRLSPCTGGHFAEAGSVKFSPTRGGKGEGLWAMAFDPLRETPGRPAGFLYAGSANSVGGKSEGKFPEALVESALGYAFALPIELPPQIKEQTFAHVTATTATLGATINPKGSPTHYAFQYETEAAYEANEPSDRFAGALEAPAGGASAGEGSEGIPRTAALSGLQPDTAYRFRAVATSHCSEAEPEKLCEADGEALALRTFPAEAPGLPDHRAWELVSPAEKHGGQVIALEPDRGSCGGACKLGSTFAKFPRQSTADGNAVAYEGTAFDSEAAALRGNEYVSRRDPQDGWQTANPTPTHLVNGGGAGYHALTTSLDRAVLKQPGPALTPEAPPGYEGLYSQSGEDPLALSSLITSGPPHRPTSEFNLEFAGASADLSRVFFVANDTLTPETPFAPEAIDGGLTKYNLYEWHEGALALVNVLPGNASTQPEKHEDFAPPSSHPVSEDGQVAYFPGESGQVYVREEGEQTLEVDDPGRFLVASSDGSKVLLDDGCLYDLQEEQCEDLTQGEGGFQGVVGESEDLSHVYFVDTEVLTGAEENANKEVAVAGQDNLYAWVQGESTRFVARLDARDNASSLVSSVGELSGDWAAPYVRTAEASPDGRYLAFTSVRSLSGYDNSASCHVLSSEPPEYAPGPCPQAFLYDSVTSTLACASCNPSGEAPIGRAALPVIASAQYLAQLPHYLTDEGRLFFDSSDSILPADTNEGVEDVYQYEPNGIGSCQREAGCIALISAGTGVTDSNFAAADPSGANVFFTTRDQLTLRDRDELADLYDAREGGGLAVETEVARTECQGEACQAPVSAPNHPTPATSALAGEGNLREEAKAKHKHRHKKKRHAAKHAHKRAAKTNHGGVK